MAGRVHDHHADALGPGPAGRRRAAGRPGARRARSRPASTPRAGPDHRADADHGARRRCSSPRGAVATSVLNARGKFAASALAPLVYNLAIIGGALLLVPVVRDRRASRTAWCSARSGTCSSRCRRWPGIGARLRPRIDLRDDQARLALVLMVPRAIGLGATPARVPGHDQPRVHARRRGAPGVQLRVRDAPDPDRRDRRPAGHRAAAVARPRGGDRRHRGVRPAAGPRPRDPRVRDDRRSPRSGSSCREDVVRLLFGIAGISEPAIEATAAALAVFLLGLTAHSLIAVLARAFYALQDTQTPVPRRSLAVVREHRAREPAGRAARPQRARGRDRDLGLAGDRGPGRPPRAPRAGARPGLRSSRRRVAQSLAAPRPAAPSRRGS